MTVCLAPAPLPAAGVPLANLGDLQRLRTRVEAAISLIQDAGSETSQAMHAGGWQRASDVLAADDAMAEAAFQLGHGDFPVRATRTRVGYILWKTLSLGAR